MVMAVQQPPERRKKGEKGRRVSMVDHPERGQASKLNGFFERIILA